MKSIIEQWNDKWRYEFYENDRLVESGLRDTFSGCCARCLELITKENNHA